MEEFQKYFFQTTFHHHFQARNAKISPIFHFDRGLNGQICHILCVKATCILIYGGKTTNLLEHGRCLELRIVQRKAKWMCSRPNVQSRVSPVTTQTLGYFSGAKNLPIVHLLLKTKLNRIHKWFESIFLSQIQIRFHKVIGPDCEC